MRAIRRNLAAFALVSAFPAVAQAAEPSFDCSGVGEGSAEAMICADEGLAALDREVARLYAKIEAQTTVEDFRMIRAYQRGWIKGRNEAWKAADPRLHVETAYRERIAVLSVQAGEVEVPPYVGYECAGGEFQWLTAVFYETEPPVGVFTRSPGGDWPQYIAVGWEDDGAIHYNTGGLDFIEREGAAEMIWAGQPMRCERR